MYTINQKRLVETFTDLAKISSPSWHEKGVIKYITKKLKKLKVPYKLYECGESYNLLATLPGTTTKEPILFSGHMDTVGPCINVKPIVTDNKITSDGTTVLGSDDKAAIAIFLEGLAQIKENNIEHGQIELLFTCAEEIGLQGMIGFDKKNLKSKKAIIFDCDGNIGRMIIKAPYHSVIDLTIKGKASHAGIAPEKGINAIKVLSEIITKFKIGKLDAESTANVGIISGGNATNIVAEEASCKMEIRSIDKIKLQKHEQKLKSIIETTTKKYNAKFSFKNKLAYSGFAFTKKDPLLQLAEKAFIRIGINPQHEISVGGSDANILYGYGVKALNIACGMQHVHSTKEYILIKDLVLGTKFMLSVVETI